MRIGIGYDVHKLVEGRKLIIGGVEIPFDKGLLGHSDADVLIHALIDALLGAMGQKDIGSHFPDSNIEYKGISSIILLKKTTEIMHNIGWKLTNADMIIAVENPRMSVHIDDMKLNIGKILDTELSNIGIKATTTEGLGFIGREEGISCRAVVLIEKLY